MGKNLLTSEQRERLKQALASGSRLGASDLRLINIDVYRERLGVNWFKYKGIIHAYAVEAIKAELGTEDFFVETHSGYGIFFFKKDVQEIQAVSQNIAARLQRQLSREAVFGDPPLGCEATSVNCDEFLRQLENEAPRTAPVRAAPAPRASAADAKPLGARYVPLWHAKYERIVGSVYVPKASQALLRRADTDYYKPSAEHALQDTQTFNAMLGHAYKLHKAGTNATIMFSVNFTTFCTPQFNKEYMLALKQTPGKLLPFLTPRFVRIPPGTPQTLLATKVQLLGTTFKRVVVHTRPLFEASMLEFVPCSIISTSWRDIERQASGDARSQRTAVDLVRAYCQTAKRLRTNALIEGLDTPAALDTAIAAGVDFASGAAIRPSGSAPFVQCTLSLHEIHAAQRPSPPPASAARHEPPVDDGVFEIQ